MPARHRARPCRRSRAHAGPPPRSAPPRCSPRRRGGRLARVDGAHPVLQVALHLQLADDEPGDDGHQQPHAQIECRHLPAEQPQEQGERDLVDHGRRDQEGEGHPQGHPGGDEADEERHRRAGAEGGDDPQARGHGIADPEPPPGEQGAGALGGEEGLDHAHDEDDADQQEQDLGCVVNEEVDRLAQVGRAREAEGGDRQVGEVREMGIGTNPQGGGDGQAPEPGDQRVAAGDDRGWAWTAASISWVSWFIVGCKGLMQSAGYAKETAPEAKGCSAVPARLPRRIGPIPAEPCPQGTSRPRWGSLYRCPGHKAAHPAGFVEAHLTGLGELGAQPLARPLHPGLGTGKA
jgi:hypothetical protein